MKFTLGITFLSCVDPSLGKIDKSSLSQETLMGLLISSITTIEDIKDEDDHFSEWYGIDLDDGDVTRIDWDYDKLGGSIDLQWLPDSVKEIHISGNAFCAWTVNLEKLPEKMTDLAVSGNNFSGTLNLTKLPRNIQTLSLSTNNFQGTVDLTQLPKSLTDLFLCKNPLEGETDFSQLPENPDIFNIQFTNLTGEIVLDRRKNYAVDKQKVRAKKA